MKKNVKNDKVLRAITIGLATMISASSSTVTVFAEEGDGESSSSTESSSESSSESSGSGETSEQISESSAPTEADNSQIIEEAKNLSDIVSNEVVPVVGAIDQAALEVVPMTDLLTEEGAAAIDQDLIAAADFIDKDATEADTLGNLGAAQDNVSQAIVIANAADDLVDKGNAALQDKDEDGKNFADRIDAFNTAADQASEDAGDVLAQVDIANNTAQTKDEAVEAKEKAKEELDNAEEGLFYAVNEYNAAQEAVINAQSELEEAIAKQQEAQKKLDEARQDLNKAGMDANAANEKMKAAQSKLQELKKEEQRLQQNEKMLSAIERQTYAMAVEYFRDALGGNNCVYNSDGTINIEESAKKLSADKIEQKVASKNKRVMILGRDLLRKILDYKLANDPNVDWDTLEIGKAEKGTVHKEAREGTVFESSDLVKGNDPDRKGQDQVVVDQENGRKDRALNTIARKDNTGVYWYDSTNKEDGGRSNRIKVTYNDKEGNEHTEYYNYIFKSAKFGDETDIANSPVYVAQVNETSDGWVATEDESVDIDDYGTVQKKLADVRTTLKEYGEAVTAVDEAQKKVQELEDKIKGLSDIVNKTGLDNSRIQALQDKLDEANKELDKAEKKKEALAEKVEEAKKAYDSIDLSRFDVSDQGSEDGSGGEAAGETVVTPGPAATPGIVLPDSVIPPTTGGGSSASAITPSISADIAEALGGATGGGAAFNADGVLGARADEESAAPGAAGSEEYSFENDAKEDGESLVRLEDMQIPLADLPGMMDEEGLELNWWWSLIITLFGATGKAMYDRHRRKEEAKVKADR